MAARMQTSRAQLDVAMLDRAPLCLRGAPRPRPRPLAIGRKPLVGQSLAIVKGSGGGMLVAGRTRKRVAARLAEAGFGLHLDMDGGIISDSQWEGL